MAILRSLLLPLGLFLCLGLLCSPASCINHNDNCTFFSKVIDTTYSGIHANPNVYKSNTVYTVSVPVNNSISSVVLRAMDQHDSVIGSWQKADKYGNGSVLYHMKSPYSKLFEAKWVSPSSMNITAVELHPTHKLNTTPTHKLNTTPTHKLTTSPTHKLTTSPTHKLTSPTHKLNTTPTHKLNTTPTHKLTTSPTHKLNTTPTHKLTTTKSSANRAFLSPMRDVIQILLIFLTSKLLF
uniref:Placenta-expressed transcript 1 protein n=1 Tax=Balaenoptera musculus TaxID=9771 RepID=A0A8C0CTD8_BALMU